MTIRQPLPFSDRQGSEDTERKDRESQTNCGEDERNLCERVNCSLVVRLRNLLSLLISDFDQLCIGHLFQQCQ